MPRISHFLSPVGIALALAACNAEPTAPSLTLLPFSADGTAVEGREPGEFYTLDNLYADASGATDPNDDALTYEYAWSKNGNRELEQNTELLRGVYTKKGDVWSVDVHAWDGKIQGPKVTAEVTILNSPPTTEVSVDTPSPRTTDDIRAIVKKSDVDNDPTTVRYVWLVNGSPQSITGDTLQDKRTTKGEVWELQAIANDGEVDGPPGIATFTIGNTPPEFLKAVISNVTPDKNSTLSCTGEGWEDVDEDPEGYQTQWLVNGAAYSTTETMVTADLNRGDVIQCQLTAFDGDDIGNTKTSDKAIMQNTAPSILTVTIGPPDPTKEDTVFPVIDGAVDPDGDPVTFEYAWYISGSLNGSTEVLPPSRFNKDDVIRLEVTPFDGELRGPAVGSNTLRAGNNPPVIDEIRLTPTSPYTDDVIEVEAFTSDPDGDDVELTYEWYVNSTKVAETGDSLDGDVYFKKGDTIYLEATPTDKEDFGRKVTTSTLTVINSVPTKPGLALDPTEPTGSTDVLCDVTDVSVDADGDALTYSFRWTVNGSAPSTLKTTTYTDDTLPASEYSGTDVITCLVTVTDGTATSPEAAASTWTGIRTFNTCGATGQSGPTSCAYTGTTLEGEVTVSGGKQKWVVPADGDYRIEAWGAQGHSADSRYDGGKGARIRGDFTLKSGDVLYIAVGQEARGNGCSGGGGGASWVVDSSNAPLVIAGGGGGTRTSVSQNGCGGRTSEAAGTGSRSSTTHGCGAKSGSIGKGGIVSSSSWGSAGGGLDSNGAYEYNSANGGKSWGNGLKGGGTSSYNAYGGFGGGGAGNGSCGGGGGGGYSGGDGGRVAGGGGSYNDGSNQSNTANTQTKAGKVTIDRL